MTRRFWLGMAAYVVGTFPLAYLWHLTIFVEQYDALGVLRDDPVVPFGFVTILIQGAFFSWAYPRLFDTARTAWIGSGVKAALAFGIIAWSFSVLAVAAKNHMDSVSGFMALESAWTVLQFAVTAPLIALAWRDSA